MNTRERLASEIRSRRIDLGLSVQKAAQLAGGIARNTWSGIETGRNRTQERHHAGIERALGWAPGSIAAILDCGEPTVVGAAGQSAPEMLDADLAAEVERIGRLPLETASKLRIIRALIDAYVEDQDHAAGPESTEQRQAG